MLRRRVAHSAFRRSTRFRTVQSRSLATQPTASTTTATSSSAAPTPIVPKRKKRYIVRKTIAYSTLLTLAAYGVGTVAAVNNERAHDFFVESVPLGEAIIDYAEAKGFVGGLPERDPAALPAPLNVPKTADPVPKPAVIPAPKTVTTTPPAPKEEPKPSKIAAAKVKAEQVTEKAKEKKEKAKTALKEGKEQLKSVAAVLHTRVEKTEETEKPIPPKPAAPPEEKKWSNEIADLVSETEAVLAGAIKAPIAKVKELVEKEVVSPKSDVPESPPNKEDEPVPPAGKEWYSGPPLPLGWEPPAGFALRPPKKVPKSNAGLLLVAPAVSEFAAAEPVLSDLASTVDNLAKFLEDHPKALKGADKVLERAQQDLVELGKQIQATKTGAKQELESKLDQQARDYNLKLLDAEINTQDQLDKQDEDWKKYFDQERLALLAKYQEKLDLELASQEDIINQRLKEEVIAQGIELQRRWLREVQMHVEEERGGRLAKLEQLTTDLKKLERVTLDNASYLDENLRLHAVWSALRALTNVTVDSATRKPFRAELEVLKKIATSTGNSDPLLLAALETLDKSDTPDVGLEPLADLSAWFTTSVVPRVSAVSLVPHQNSGVLLHVASSILSSLRFKPRGLIEGNDSLSIMARAEYYLNEKDLDSAARELNQIQGPGKVLLTDWLNAARHRLEAQQALEVVQAQCTLSSLLIL